MNLRSALRGQLCRPKLGVPVPVGLHPSWVRAESRAIPLFEVAPTARLRRAVPSPTGRTAHRSAVTCLRVALHDGVAAERTLYAQNTRCSAGAAGSSRTLLPAGSGHLGPGSGDRQLEALIEVTLMVLVASSRVPITVTSMPRCSSAVLVRDVEEVEAVRARERDAAAPAQATGGAAHVLFVAGLLEVLGAGLVGDPAGVGHVLGAGRRDEREGREEGNGKDEEFLHLGSP